MAAERKKTPSKAPKRTPVKKVLNQLALGATQTQVAKSVNVSKQAVSQMLQRYGIESKFLESFKENRADILAGMQDTVLASLTEVDLNKASLRDRVISFGVLYDKERLERGQSTSNVAVILASAAIEAGKQWAKPVDNTEPLPNTPDQPEMPLVLFSDSV